MSFNETTQIENIDLITTLGNFEHIRASLTSMYQASDWIPTQLPKH
jgi:hypothetical protein